ncbi:unnamed protein product [Notodromas monacha]|uniref:Vesicular inhibitory amino acid transporter n=1 Tax=Notodromas monacha TaxID=399045 RepID=A0A7R9BPU5_9CRUS|nr:unnamed protein product [Notodromas monacha]CAG0919423.1 unnamed protein product [Notodromas monacha]
MASMDFAEAADEFGRPMKKENISEWQAGWNVTNAIQGMFVVSLPYAVLHGGYWALIALMGVAHICCYTGRILVDCLYEEGEDGSLVRVRDSYASIAVVCFGPRFGGKLVSTAQVIELLMTCILYVAMCGDLMHFSFEFVAVDIRSWMMICGVVLLPCAFLRDLHMVSTLSFWCTVAHGIVNIIIFGYCLTCAGDWGWGDVDLGLDLEKFPIALGLIVFSYTSQIFLPTLEGNMRDPTKFWCMLKWSHIAAGAFKTLFAYVGFMTFRFKTKDAITDNMPVEIRRFVNMVLVVKAMLSYPLPYFAAIEVLQMGLFMGKPATLFPSCVDPDSEVRVWAMALRVGLVVFTVLSAISIPHFNVLMGLIGSFTGTMLSFVWPCYFHLKLKAHVMTPSERAYDYFVIFLGVLFGVVGIIDSGREMVHKFQLGLPI